jgi:hypothetical protein
VTQRGIERTGVSEASRDRAMHPQLTVTKLARPLLHCTKFDLAGLGANPNAKKYRSAVSFRVVAGAFGGYFLLYKIKFGGARIVQNADRFMEADSGT